MSSRFQFKGLDWIGTLEDFVFRVIEAERRGNEAIDLSTAPLPGPDSLIEVAGLRLPKQHPSILFGDGGTCKSLLGLWVLGQAAERGMRVGYFDWELDASQHRQRLGQLFPGGLPTIHYIRMRATIAGGIGPAEAHSFADLRLEYAVYDSVAVAAMRRRRPRRPQRGT